MTKLQFTRAITVPNVNYFIRTGFCSIDFFEDKIFSSVPKNSVNQFLRMNFKIVSVAVVAKWVMAMKPVRSEDQPKVFCFSELVIFAKVVFIILICFAEASEFKVFKSLLNIRRTLSQLNNDRKQFHFSKTVFLFEKSTYKEKVKKGGLYIRIRAVLNDRN